MRMYRNPNLPRKGEAEGLGLGGPEPCGAFFWDSGRSLSWSLNAHSFRRGGGQSRALGATQRFGLSRGFGRGARTLTSSCRHGLFLQYGRGLELSDSE